MMLNESKNTSPMGRRVDRQGMHSLALGACMALFLFTVPISVLEADVNLKVSVNRDKIQIADPFEFEIRLLAPKGTQVAFPPKPESLGAFDVLSVKDRFDVPVSSENGDDRLWVRSMSLETLETGRLEIPTIETAVKSPGQPEKIHRTEPIAVDVQSVIEPATDLTKFKEIAGVNDVAVPESNSYGWIWAASGATFLALAGGALFIATRRKGAVSAKVWAFEKIRDAREVAEAETIVRQFISERFGIPATSLPGDQVLADLRSRDVEDSVLRKVQELLENSERAKFGGLDLPETEKARLINLASHAVEMLDQVREAN